MLKRLLHRPAAQRAGAYVIGRYLSFALRTTRWTVLGTEHLVSYVAGQPGVVASWHENLALLPALLLEFRRLGGNSRVYALASRHRDGRMIGAVLAQFGVGLVHASTSRGGASGLRSLLQVLGRGGHVVLVPDGPRGPRRTAAPGAVQLAALSGAAVLPVGVRTNRRRILRSWDRMAIPLPFGRGVMILGAPLHAARGNWQTTLPLLEAALTETTDEAERLCAR